MQRSERAELLLTLNTLIRTRLFESDRWLPDAEVFRSICDQLLKWNLQEPVPGEDGGTRDTPLGRELNVTLLMVFLGVFAPWDAVMILQEQELIDEDEACHLH